MSIMLTEKDLEIIEAMQKYGGSFVKALAECFWHADSFNFVKLKDAFPGYWAEYAEKADRIKKH